MGYPKMQPVILPSCIGAIRRAPAKGALHGAAVASANLSSSGPGALVGLPKAYKGHQQAAALPAGPAAAYIALLPQTAWE